MMCTSGLNKGYLKENKTQPHDIHTVLFVATCMWMSTWLTFLCVCLCRYSCWRQLSHRTACREVYWTSHFIFWWVYCLRLKFEYSILWLILDGKTYLPWEIILHITGLIRRMWLLQYAGIAYEADKSWNLSVRKPHVHDF